MGVTGHQKLPDPGLWTWVSKTLEKELDRISLPLVGVTCLAAGADQLGAECILRRNGELYVVLPFPDIERSFSGDALHTYRHLLQKASTVEIVDDCPSDEEAYLAAGKRVVDLSDILIAVWDGMPAKGKGGTADVVAYARTRQVPVIHIDTQRRRVAPHRRRKPE